MKLINKKILIPLFITVSAFSQDANSDLTNMLGDLFYYERQNNETLQNNDANKIDDIKNNNQELKKVLQEQLLNIVSTDYPFLSVSQQEKIVQDIMKAKVLSNNEIFSSLSQNNRIAVDMVNQYFDQYIVNNSKNVFVGQIKNDQDYSKFISYKNEEKPLIGADDDSGIFIVPMDISNTVNIPLKIFNQYYQSCDIHFISSPTSTHNMSDIKVFKYNNNRINWLRLENEESTSSNCTKQFNTNGTGDFKCHTLNSHGTKYHEKVMVPGMAYVYAPLTEEAYSFESDGSGTGTRILSDSNLNVSACPSTIPNGNADSYTLPTDPLSDYCLHYFDYIKYIINYDIDLASGEFLLTIKENTNPFDEEMQEFLIPTKLFMGDFSVADQIEEIDLGSYGGVDVGAKTITADGVPYSWTNSTSTTLYTDQDNGYTFEVISGRVIRKLIVSSGTEIQTEPNSSRGYKDVYETTLTSNFDIHDLESVMGTAYKLYGNIFSHSGYNFSNNCSLNPTVIKLDIESLVNNLIDEKYLKIIENVSPSSTDPITCPSGYTWFASYGKCVKDSCNSGYVDNNNGTCYRNSSTTNFGTDSLYNYLIIN